MFKNSVMLVAVLGLISLSACSNVPSSISTPSSAVISATALTSQVQTVTDTTLHIPATGVKPAGSLRVWMITNPTPLKPGNGVLDAYVVDANGQPVDDAVLTFTINMTNMNMGNNVTQPPLVGPGHYSKTVRFSMAGPWRVTIKIVREGQTNTVAFDFNVTY